MPATNQLALQLRSGHAGHDNVQDQTPRVGDAIGSEELLRRSEGFCRETDFPQQVRERFAHGLIVINDRD